jgi:hypothetical protein
MTFWAVAAVPPRKVAQQPENLRGFQIRRWEPRMELKSSRMRCARRDSNSQTTCSKISHAKRQRPTPQARHFARAAFEEVFVGLLPASRHVSILGFPTGLDASVARVRSMCTGPLPFYNRIC